MSQALIIVDMLNDFVRPGAVLEVPATRDILPGLQRRLESARQEGLPVIYLCDAHAPDDAEFARMGWPPHAVRGTEGARVVAELAPRPGEAVVAKTTYSGFFGTDLDTLLRRRQIDELVLTGCVTNICILYTAADAAMRGYRVRVPASCVAALNDADGAFALRQMQHTLGIDVDP